MGSEKLVLRQSILETKPSGLCVSLKIQEGLGVLKGITGVFFFFFCSSFPLYFNLKYIFIYNAISKFGSEIQQALCD
jgi:hypothetical protein